MMEDQLLIIKSNIKEVKNYFIDRWMVLGPFVAEVDFKDISRDEKQFLIDPNFEYNAINSSTKWKDLSLETINADFLELNKYYSSDSVVSSVFLSCFVYSPKDLEAELVIISCDEITGIIDNLEINFEKQSGKYSGRVVFKHGWNLIAIKCTISNGSDGIFTGAFVNYDKNKSELVVKSGFMLGADTDSQLFGKDPDDACQAIELGRPSEEVYRSNPDIVTYVPRQGDEYNDGDNEHFLVFEAPKSKGLLAMWNQATREPYGDNHIVLARSDDGVNWSEPEWIVGTHKGTQETQASWGFPVVSKTGRLYCFYTKSPQGTPGGLSHIMGGLFSDDEGRTWTEGPDVTVPSLCNNNNRSSSDYCIIVWQKPFYDKNNRLLAGYTVFSDDQNQQGCHMMRFDNIDQGPDLHELQISWLTANGTPIVMPNQEHCSEPSVVLLPDGRLFSTVRTMTGYVWYSLSEDDGITWSVARVLRRCDQGAKIKNPLSCCPIYQLQDGRFMLIHSNNSYYADMVAAGKPIPAGMSQFSHRRPAHISIGEYRPKATQPIWFSEPKVLLDNDGVHISPKGSNEIATYTSMTYFENKQVLWYPDRKYYLLGKYITDDIIGDMC